MVKILTDKEEYTYEVRVRLLYNSRPTESQVQLGNRPDAYPIIKPPSWQLKGGVGEPQEGRRHLISQNTTTTPNRTHGIILHQEHKPIYLYVSHAFTISF